MGVHGKEGGRQQHSSMASPRGLPCGSFRVLDPVTARDVGTRHLTDFKSKPVVVHLFTG